MGEINEGYRGKLSGLYVGETKNFETTNNVVIIITPLLTYFTVTYYFHNCTGFFFMECDYNTNCTVLRATESIFGAITKL